jgi:hypothetical protein
LCGVVCVCVHVCACVGEITGQRLAHVRGGQCTVVRRPWQLKQARGHLATHFIIVLMADLAARHILTACQAARAGTKYTP